MKICSSCKQCKDTSEFHKNSTKKDGLNNNCKVCAIEKSKISYAKSSDRIIKRSNEDRSSLAQIINNIKAKYKCQFCSEDDPVCLDFHHVESEEKESGISQLVYRKKRKLVFDEMRKCIIVCSNCHRKIHANKLLITKSIFCDENLEDYFLVKDGRCYTKGSIA